MTTHFALTQRGEARRQRSNRRAHEQELQRGSTTGETRRCERPVPSPAWTGREISPATAGATTRDTPPDSCEPRWLRRIPRREPRSGGRAPSPGKRAIRQSRPLPAAGRGLD